MAPPRLQQMLLCMQKCDYTILYKPGRDMVLANYLNCLPSWSNNLPIPIAYNVQHVQLSKAELNIIQGSMECDPVYSTIYHLTLRGWTKCWQDVPDMLPSTCGAQWMNCLSNTAYSSKGTRVCVPLELPNHTLADLHGAHHRH